MPDAAVERTLEWFKEAPRDELIEHILKRADERHRLIKEIRDCMYSSQRLAKQARDWEVLARRFAKLIPEPELPKNSLMDKEESTDA
ncbi:MAG: hypothetical protein V3U34_00650 [candidate division NC10 bacterium]